MGLGMYVCMLFVCCPFVGIKHLIDYKELKNNYCGDDFPFLVNKRHFISRARMRD